MASPRAMAMPMAIHKVFVLAVHEVRGEHRRQRSRIPDGKVEPVPSRRDDDHLAEAEEGDEGRELYRQQHLREAQEIGVR